jgi:starvation-inducible DNA-binding protein
MSANNKITGLLNANLADTIHFVLQSKQAHWNVKGPNFYSLHLLFDELYKEASEWADNLAERTVQLGGVAEGDLVSVSKNSHLPNPSLTLVQGPDHIAALVKSITQLRNNYIKGIDQCEEFHDKPSADLFTELSREADKMKWFLESHLVT